MEGWGLGLQKIRMLRIFSMISGWSMITVIFMRIPTRIMPSEKILKSQDEAMTAYLNTAIVEIPSQDLACSDRFPALE